MDTALAVLLYLNVITSPGTYYTSQLSNFEQIYSQPMANVENNLPLLEAVLAEYEPLEVGITVLDDGVLR